MNQPAFQVIPDLTRSLRPKGVEDVAAGLQEARFFSKRIWVAICSEQNERRLLSGYRLKADPEVAPGIDGAKRRGFVGEESLIFHQRLRDFAAVRDYDDLAITNLEIQDEILGHRGHY